MKEDKFQFQISDKCIKCGKCRKTCPAQAISMGDIHMEIDKEKCIDCGTCSSVCPVGAANPGTVIRESIGLADINPDNLYLNAGCAVSKYRPEIPALMCDLLKGQYPNIKKHNLCCRFEPNIPEGSTIISNCAGCDRRFRSRYDGVQTISFWEMLDSLEDVELPNYEGMTVSIHDSCSYRHKPQVHAAVRSLLRRMNIKIEEAKLHGTSSICCGDSFYGFVPNEDVEKRMKMRADQMPCDIVVAYCIGCVRAMQSCGKTSYHMLDLIFNCKTDERPDTLEEYHNSLDCYREKYRSE